MAFTTCDQKVEFLTPVLTSDNVTFDANDTLSRTFVDQNPCSAQDDVVPVLFQWLSSYKVHSLACNFFGDHIYLPVNVKEVDYMFKVRLLYSQIRGSLYSAKKKLWLICRWGISPPIDWQCVRMSGFQQLVF